MKEQEIVEELERRGIILRDGHFRYTSGKHGEDYIDKNALLAHSTLSGSLVRKLVHEMSARWLDDQKVPFPDVVVGPAMSGAILAHLVAHELDRVPNWTDGQTVYAAFVEKDPAKGVFTLGRNYDKVVRGRKVLVVEDVINTGGTAMAAAHSVMVAGGIVVGVAVIWNRGVSDKLTLPNAGGGVMELPVTALVHHPLPSYTEAECRKRGPCSRNVRLSVNFGHGAAFLAKDKKEA